MRKRAHVLCVCGVLFLGCGELPQDEEELSTDASLTRTGEVFYAAEVVSFEPGEGAGYGAQKMPGVVLGAPKGGSARQGSLDVVSLGVGGAVTLGFGEWDVVDGPGVDLVVFENAFLYTSQDLVFSERGEVSVSEDGERWVVFTCEEDGTGCAGMTPTLDEMSSHGERSAAMMGGDGFDLAEVGLERVRYVRITDRAGKGASPTAGFDLDAVGAFYGVMQKR